MALFIFKPSTVQKNVPANFQIDYADLASYASVPEGYFKDINNWKRVTVQMKHKFSGQKGSLIFNKPSDVASLHLKDTARGGGWELDRVLIQDYDRGELLLQRADIPSVTNYDFIAASAATHGDLWVGPSQVVTIPSGGKRQYGDFVVELGGTLRLADGGGITEIEVLDNCIINGTIEANNGTHTGGVWNSTSVLSESLNLTITQKAGGNGGEGEGTFSTVRTPATDDYFTTWETMWMTNHGDTTIMWEGVIILNGGTPTTPTSHTVGGVTYYRGALRGEVNYPDFIEYGIYRISEGNVAGGSGGLQGNGNGGGGGRSTKFGALNGGDAIPGLAGLGAGQDDPAADEYGEAGAPSLTQSEAGSGGFRGKHGQALYIKAKKILGTGTINATGQKGGDGGDGAEYLDGGILYGNGAGGGGAGGDGGKIWLRYQTGPHSLSLLTSGGAQGNRGIGGFGSTEAQHGTPGSTGSSNAATW